VLKHPFAALLVAVMGLGLSGTAHAQAGNGPATAANDYADGKSWLCRPGRTDACRVDLTTTIVAANGTLTRETWSGRPDAPIDCFYVYPTVSTDPTDNSDMTADAAELNVVRTQFARFGSACRLYAPLYRQVTLAGLQKTLATGATGATDRSPLTAGIAYDDVAAAWKYYLEHDNQGRGVVLIGHSQGSFVLAELIRREIDGKPVQSRLVSALLLGATIGVPKGKDVGGMFQHVPLCHAATQTGCLITYASFRSTVPPPSNTLFGRVTDPNQVAACTNPAALAGGSGELRAYLSATGTMVVGRSPLKPWVTPEKPIDTPWVSVPGLLTAECRANDNASGYLEITVHGNAADPRVDDIAGDLGVGTAVLANWGLHLIDVDLAIGNLVDIVDRQATAYSAKKSR
jgi:pimeloyl-ACP methyl ester carboxylesterase